MQVLGTILLVIGFIASTVGGIWFLVVAFRKSILWGLGCLLVPFVALVFLIKYWNESAKPFLVSLAGTGLTIIGGVLSGMSAA